MRSPRWKTIPLAVLTLISLLSLLIAPNPISALAQPDPPPQVTYRAMFTADRFDISSPLRDISPADLASFSAAGLYPVPDLPASPAPSKPSAADPLVQSFLAPAVMPTTRVNFDALPNISNVTPPNPSGEVGLNHYVLMTNLSFAIYTKTGALLYGPALNNILWSGFGGPCQTQNSGGAHVLYDQLADRWIMAQPTYNAAPYYLCVAMSTTPDPTGTYYRWAFSTGANMPDYAKFAVWPNALFASTREFSGGTTFVGVGVYAFNKAEMIVGNPTPQVISFFASAGTNPYNIGDGLMPADLEGDTLPPWGSPGYFLGSMDNGGPYGATQDALTLWKFAPNFTTPAVSTFSLTNTIPVASFDSMYPCPTTSRNCIPQPDTTVRLDVLSYRQRLLWRVTYRNFGDHEALVMNQSVEAADSMAGIRWYELRSPNTTPVLYQQGTYAPGLSDGIQRWAGSLAMDKVGNIAIGYSASNATTTYPSIFYTGRLSADPLGTMMQGEGVIVNGTGSQTSSNHRWGDFSSMTVDPVDGCTFWFASEYVPVTSSVGWKIRVGAFKFPGCSPEMLYLPVITR